MMSKSERVHRRSASGEEGFTLVELLIVVVIMPLVVGAIAYGLVTVFSLQSSVTQSLSGSGDLQKVSAQYMMDIQSSSTIFLGTSPQRCGASGVQMVGLSWSGGETTVSYVRVQMTNNSTDYALERLYCTLGNATTPSSTTVLSSDFYLTKDLITQNPPQVCLHSAINLSAPGNCTGADGTYTSAQISAVAFTLYVPKSSTPSTLVASPRGGSAGIGSNGPFPTLSPVTLLGSTCGTGPSDGTLVLKNNGQLTINVGTGSGNGTLGLANCPASSVYLANNGTINAQGIVTGQPSTTGISTGSNPGTSPTSISYSPGMGDPLNPPTGPSLLNTPNVPTACGTGTGQIVCGSCKESGKTWTCTAGFYDSTNLPAFKTNGVFINFDGGTTETVFSTDLTIPNGANATFGSGVYVFSAKDGTALNTGTDGNSIQGTGVLFYVPTGGVNFSNNTLISLSGIKAGTSGLPYNQGVTIWLAGTAPPGTSPPADGVLHLANNTAQNNSYGGIYVPNGGVVSDNNGILLTTFIYAGWAMFTQNTVIQITY